ncbi:hypothetical protein [Nocardioides sp.]|uniref:hypothetical protein n=1 Tax=Nocardioides sp. TaxID=35761 RepID=UPI00271E019D|nr:hypothetical protein [Nocardioides sp.]MDO9456301.1 hypothetical protein [Nocardioides sp.]
MSRTSHALGRLCAALLTALLATALLPLAPASARLPLEDFADYQPASRCAPAAKPGARELSRWLVKRHGSHASISRGCRRGSAVSSEHQEGRAIDWFADAGTKRGRAAARRVLDDLFAPDADGNPAVKARRMGVMYVIWNDRMYSAWRQFEPEPYLSSSCRNRRSCSKTLRHRDHVHVSLTRRAARGKTSWYVARDRRR